jgi:hypothetical protein
MTELPWLNVLGARHFWHQRVNDADRVLKGQTLHVDLPNSADEFGCSRAR